MAFDPATALLNVANTVLDRILPDKAANSAAKAQLLEMQVKGEIDTTIAQAQINQAEAQNKSVFVAGWRPGVGWACAIAFAYTYVLQPFMAFILTAAHHPVALPPVNLADMMPVLVGMLGLGAYRTIDKAKGVGGGA